MLFWLCKISMLEAPMLYLMHPANFYILHLDEDRSVTDVVVGSSLNTDNRSQQPPLRFATSRGDLSMGVYLGGIVGNPSVRAKAKAIRRSVISIKAVVLLFQSLWGSASTAHTASLHPHPHSGSGIGHTD